MWKQRVGVYEKSERATGDGYVHARTYGAADTWNGEGEALRVGHRRCFGRCCRFRRGIRSCDSQSYRTEEESCKTHF